MCPGQDTLMWLYMISFLFRSSSERQRGGKNITAGISNTSSRTTLPTLTLLQHDVCNLFKRYKLRLRPSRSWEQRGTRQRCRRRQAGCRQTPSLGW